MIVEDVHGCKVFGGIFLFWFSLAIFVDFDSPALSLAFLLQSLPQLLFHKLLESFSI